jgi:hypothetical protein
MRIVRDCGVRYRPEQVLITTPPWDVYRSEGYGGDVPCFTSDHRVDWFAGHPIPYPEAYKPSVRARPTDLAFLAANVPGPTYLEIPDERTVLEQLSSGKYKVLGISAYTWTLPWALAIARRAKREYGVEETWLGGYATMTPEPEIERCFDRVFAGYSESILREIFGMGPLDAHGIVHPDLTVSSTYLGRQVKVGHLFWQRGCTQRCAFCADPVFQPGGEPPFSIENVREVIDHYKATGCISVHLTNQDVRPFSRAGKKVIELLSERKMPFTMMASFQAITAKGKEGIQWLREMGCTMVQPGIESLDDVNLDKHRKSATVAQIERAVEMLNEVGVRLSATYMICFEHDTAASIRQAQRRLAQLGPMYTYFSIVQPMPGTPFYEDLCGRGLIHDFDWRRWTNGYLVWKHPTISPEQARELLMEMESAVNTPLLNPMLRRDWKRIERLDRRLDRRPSLATAPDTRELP